MPHRSITHQQDSIFRICLGQLIQEYIHAVCIAVWENQKKTFSILRFHRSTNISIFTNVMTWNGRPLSFLAPAALRFVNASKSCFVLEHQPYILAGVWGNDFVVLIFNFFEESCSSRLADLGCFALGMTFLHPFRFITRYT